MAETSPIQGLLLLKVGSLSPLLLNVSYQKYLQKIFANIFYKINLCESQRLKPKLRICLVLPRYMQKPKKVYCLFGSLNSQTLTISVWFIFKSRQEPCKHKDNNIGFGKKVLNKHAYACTNISDHELYKTTKPRQPYFYNLKRKKPLNYRR